jgi:ELP3 family radical SAM enzyme/protein acetyltransferase
MNHEKDVRIIDIEDLNKKYEKHINIKYHLPNAECVNKLKPYVDKLLINPNSQTFHKLKKEFHYSHKNSVLYQVFLSLQKDDPVTYNEEQRKILQHILKIKHGKDLSGIISITVFTSAYPEYIDEDGNIQLQKFSCQWNCAYCPNEPGQPRSYLKGEPGVLRANREEFDCERQMRVRLDALYYTGHEIDKLEINVLGGTWTSYPLYYREQFIRDIYYSANTYQHCALTTINNKELPRNKLSLSEEKRINETANVRVIGLTLETRPDTITPEEIRRFRYYGCTRLQLGIQHIDNNVLKTIRRDCTTERTIEAIELLKNCGYKIDAHWMPNLPGSNLKLDESMLIDTLLGVKNKIYGDDRSMKGEYWEHYNLVDPSLQVDQWKVYPCTIVPFTDIEKWYLDGSFIQYSQNDMIDLIVKMKKLIFPWIRLNRIIRDIPNDYALRKDYYSNIRQDVTEIIHNDGWYCSCIRCREVKNGMVNEATLILKVRCYRASRGDEYFISFESNDSKILYGFVRLRLTRYPAEHVFPELVDCAMIRELHVYGQLKVVLKQTTQRNDIRALSIQHRGFGKKLMKKAETIAKNEGFHKMSVISGEGTREYYRRLGYYDAEGEGKFMIKKLL